MPTNVVKTPGDEKKWRKAKAIAAKQGKSKNYAYIMGIYKNMGGLDESSGGIANVYETIIEKLRQGHTVRITNYGRTTATIDPKKWADLEKSGTPWIKLKNGELYIRRGRSGKYDCWGSDNLQVQVSRQTTESSQSEDDDIQRKVDALVDKYVSKGGQNKKEAPGSYNSLDRKYDKLYLEKLIEFRKHLAEFYSWCGNNFVHISDEFFTKHHRRFNLRNFLVEQIDKEIDALKKFIAAREKSK